MAKKNTVDLNVVIKAITEGNISNLAEKEGADFVKAYEKALKKANELKINTDMRAEGKLIEELSKTIIAFQKLSEGKIVSKNLTNYLDKLTKSIAKLKEQTATLGNLFDGSFDIQPQKQNKPNKSDKNNNSQKPTVDLSGLKAGLDKGNEYLERFLNNIKEFMNKVQAIAKTKVTFYGIKEGLKEVNDDIKTSFEPLKKNIVQTGKMLRDLGKNTGKNIPTRLKSIIKDIKSLNDVIKDFGSTLTDRINTSLNAVATATGRMASLITSINTQFKNLDVSGINKIRTELASLSKDFPSLDKSVKDIGSGAGEKMLSSLRVLRNRINVTKKLLKEASAEAKVFYSSFSGTALADVQEFRRALSGVYARLKAISRLKMPTMTKLPANTSIANTVDKLVKGFEKLPSAMDKAINSMTSSLTKLESGLNAVYTVVDDTVTKIMSKLENLSKGFDPFKKQITVTGKMLRDLGKNLGKNIPSRIKSIGDSFKSLNNTINNFGSGLPTKISNALNSIATATGRMASLITSINNQFKNIDLKALDKIKTKINELKADFSSLDTAGRKIGSGTAETMLSALRRLRNRIAAIIKLFREASKEAKNFYGAFSGQNISSLIAYNSALSGIYDRLRAISRLNLPNAPRIPSNNGGSGSSGGGSTNNASNSTNRFADAMKKATMSVGGFISSINNAIVKFNVIYYGLPNIMNTVSAPFRSGFEFEQSMETSKLGIAGIVSQMGRVNGERIDFNDSLGVAEGVLKRLNLEAIRTAASTKDLVETFRGLAAPGLGAGFDLSQVEKFTVVGVNAAKAMNLPATQFIQELRDLVQGGIQASSSTIATSLGLRDADIKKMKESSKGLFASLMEYMEGFTKSAEAYPATFAGMIDQMSEYATLASAEFTKAFEPEIKGAMKMVQNLFGQIKTDENGRAIGFEVSPRVMAIVDALHKGVSELSVIWERFLSSFGSFDADGVFQLNEQGVALWNNVAELAKTIWSYVLWIGERLADIAPVIVNIMTDVTAIANKILVVIGYLTDMFTPTKAIAENWDTIKGYIYGAIIFATTLTAMIKTLAGLNAFLLIAQQVGVFIDGMKAAIPLIKAILSQTRLLAVWNAISSLVKDPKTAMAVLGISAVLGAAYAGIRFAGYDLSNVIDKITEKIGTIAEAWENVKEKISGTMIFLTTLMGMLTIMINRTKILAAWNAIASIAQNPKIAMAIVGGGLAIAGVSYAGAKLAGHNPGDVFDTIKKKIGSFIGDITGSIDAQIPKQEENNTDSNKSGSEIDPSEIKGDEKVDEKALEKAEKERLKQEKRALKEALAILKAGLKEQLNVLKDAFEQVDLLYKQEAIGWQEYYEKKAQNEVDIAQANINSLTKQISAIENTDFENEEDKNAQLAPLYEQLGEFNRQLQKSIDAQNDIATIMGRTSQYTYQLLNEVRSQRNKSVSNGSKNGSNTQINGGTDEQRIAIQKSRQYGLDPAVALAIMEIESGQTHRDDYGNIITSEAGALGAMQLMPSTAASLGVDPYDMEQNIEGGVKYIKQMLDMFGDVSLALAAYNAGPQAVIDAGYAIPNYGETQGYVPAYQDVYEKNVELARQLTSASQNIADSAVVISNAEDSTWYRETPDVDIENLEDVALQAISAVSQKFYELTGRQATISSGYRDWGGHISGKKFDMVDDATHDTLEDNKNGIRDAIIAFAESIGLEVLDEYENPSARATAGHLDFNASEFDPSRIADGVLEPIDSALGVAKTQLGLEAKEAYKKALTRANEVTSEYNEVFGDISQIPIIQLRDKWAETSNFLKKNLNPSESSNVIAMGDIVQLIKENKLKLKQQTEYIEGALQYVSDNAERLANVIGEEFLFVGSNIAEYTKKYMSYFKGGNYTGGITGLDFNEIGLKLKRIATTAINAGDRKTYFEVKEKMKQIEDSLLSYIDKFQQAIKDNAEYVNEWVDLSDMTSFQKDYANKDTEAKMYQQLAESERQRAIGIEEQNAKKIADYRQLIEEANIRLFEKETELKAKINELNTEDADYLAKKLDLKEQIAKIQQETANIVQQNEFEISNAEKDVSSEKAWRNATILQLKYQKALRDTRNTLKEIGQTAKQSLEDGLVTFLTDGVNECATLAEALNNLLVGILKDIQKKFAENLALDIMNAWFPSTGDKGAKDIEIQKSYEAALALEMFKNAVNESTKALNGTGSNGLASATMDLFTTAGAATLRQTNSSNTITIGANASGGYIKGPGTGTSDSILSRLSNGEFVVKAASVKKYGTSMLERINNGTFSNMRVNVPKFANGGYVGSMAGSLSDGLTDRLSQSFSSNVSVTNYVDGSRVVNPEMIKSIVRKVNVQDAKRNSEVMKRFR